jgi:hypothetical protein
VFYEGFEAFEGEGEMGSALGGDQGVDLIEDHGINVAKGLGRLGGEQEIERLGSGDEDVGRVAAEALTLALGGVAGADADGRFMEGDPVATGHIGDAGKGGAEVAFNVDSEGLEGGDVDDAAARVLSHRRMEHEAVETPEERGEGFAGSGGGEDEGAFAARDDGPAEALRGGGCVEDGAEPFGGDGMEAGKGVSINAGRIGRRGVRSGTVPTRPRIRKRFEDAASRFSGFGFARTP